MPIVGWERLKKTYQNYEITAFTEADLLNSGDTNLGCGDTFTMPGSATTCISVTDNDPYLSGDSYCNENADDHYGQHASIIGANGDELGNGGQIYAESYWWVSDQQGNWYVMIEMEQEGTGGDYFTFYAGGGYSLPPEGAVLTVDSQCNVSGDWLNYNGLGAGACGPATGTVSGTVFCDEDCDGINGEVQIVPGDDYTIEAEHMYDYGFHTVSGAQASGGKLVKLDCAGGDGKLYTYFNGNNGTYDLKIRVQDENDGQSTIKLLVNGVYVDAVKLDADTDGGGSNDGGFSTYVIQDVDINHGDKIKLVVYGDSGEYVRIDKIDLEGEDTTMYTPEPTKAGVTVNLIDATGAVVATTVTDTDGNYEFTEVPVGDYKVMGVAPDGTEFTIKDAGGDDSIDSDVGADGMSDTITVTENGVVDVDLGVCEIQVGSVSGTVFCDVECDGLNGQVQIVPGDDYTIEAEHMYDYGFHTVSGAQASGGKLVKLDCAGGDGKLYTYFNGNNGTYDLKIRVQDENDGQSTIKLLVNGVYVDAVKLDADTDGGGSNDGGFSTYVIQDVDINHGDKIKLVVYGDSGEYVRIDKIDLEGEDTTMYTPEPTKAGVTVNLIDATGAVVATTVTDTDGNYAFTNVPVGDYKIMGVAPDGTEFTIKDAGSDDTIDSDVGADGMSDTVTVTDGGNVDIDLGVCEKEPGALSGTYFCDEDRDGIDDGAANGDKDVAGKTVTLLNADGTPANDIDGNPVASVLTDANGDYRFDNLAEGDYVVMFEATDGKAFVAPNVGTDDTVDSDVVDAANGKTASVTVVAGEETTDVDAGVEDILGSLSGRYFCDENDNAVDDGEPGIAGATVTLLDATGATKDTTTTDSNGNYTFTGLVAGIYSVVFAAEATGKTFVARDQGGDDTIDSDVDPATGATGPIIVGIGEAVSDVDAGVEDPGTALVGDTVWLDANGNGIRDTGEAGVDGVEVKLFEDTDGDGTAETFVAASTTAGGGQYLFSGLDAGSYAVMFGGLTGYSFTTASAAAADAVNDDSDAGAGGMTGLFDISIGEAERDIDAGLVLDNRDPEPQDDAKSGCYDEEICIDVLANDTDPDTDSLTVSAVNGIAVTTNVAVDLGDGILVTLDAFGQLCFDGTGNTDVTGLLTGEELTFSYSYTIEDGNGGSASANVDVEFCGATDTIGKICATLKDVTVTLDLGGSQAELWEVTLTSGDVRFNGTFEEAYCLDRAAPLAPGVISTSEATVSLLEEDCFDFAAFSDFDGTTSAIGQNALDHAGEINWILNNRDTALTDYTDAEIQSAIWSYTNNDPGINAFYDVGADGVNDYLEVVGVADGNADYVVPTGGLVAAVLNPDATTSVPDGMDQPFIIGLSLYEDCLC